MKRTVKREAFFVCVLVFLGWALSPVWAAEKKEIVIGYSAPITGGMAHGGEKVKEGYIIWEKMVNEHGGIFVKEYGRKLPAKIIGYDDRSDPTTGAKLYEKLITADKVDFVFSPLSSSIGFSVSAICEKYRMPVVFSNIASDRIYKQGYEYIFCLYQLASRHLWNAVEILKDPSVIPDPPKKLLVIASKDLYDLTVSKGSMKRAQEFGFKCEYEEVEKGVKDFTGIIGRAKSSGIDGVVAALWPEGFFLFFRQMQELNYRPKYINGIHGANIRDCWDMFGKRAEGIVTGGWYGSDWPTFQNKEFVDRYKRKWNAIPTHYAGGAGAAQVIHQAIEKAGTLDREKVRQVLLTDEFKCIMYPRVKFVKEGDFKYINEFAFTAVNQWQDGKLVTVYPTKLAQRKILYPFPANW